MSNATNLESYRQRKHDRVYKQLILWVPGYCWRNLQGAQDRLRPGFGVLTGSTTPPPLSTVARAGDEHT
jgi:hypothetical protein